MKRKGFTLIELLVVIAIIAILVSILLPSIAKARELARRAVCKTNLKGFVNAMVIYQDAFGKYPSLSDTGRTWSDPGGLFDTIGEMAQYDDSNGCNINPIYLLHTYCDMELEQFGCPSDELFVSVREEEDFDPDKLGFYDWHNMSYAFPRTSSRLKDKYVALNRYGIIDTTIYMVSDRPREEEDIEAGEDTRLEKGSEPHGEDGCQYLAYNGGVSFEANNFHDIELDVEDGNTVFDDFYRKSTPKKAKREILLRWGNTSTNGKYDD